MDALIEKGMKHISITVTCPRCYKEQSVKLDEISKIRLGADSSAYTGTGEMPKVQCENCKNSGMSTLIYLNEAQYAVLSKPVINAIEKRPAKYIEAEYDKIKILKSL